MSSSCIRHCLLLLVFSLSITTVKMKGPNKQLNSKLVNIHFKKVVLALDRNCLLFEPKYDIIFLTMGPCLSLTFSRKDYTGEGAPYKQTPTLYHSTFKLSPFLNHHQRDGSWNENMFWDIFLLFC